MPYEEVRRSSQCALHIFTQTSFLEVTDTNKYAMSSAHSNEIVSLCVTGTDRNGKEWLFRCADLNNKGHYHVFVFCKMKIYPHISQIEIEFTFGMVRPTMDSMEFEIGLQPQTKMIPLRII